MATEYEPDVRKCRAFSVSELAAIAAEKASVIRDWIERGFFGEVSCGRYRYRDPRQLQIEVAALVRRRGGRL
jgi:hypothetical protein